MTHLATIEGKGWLVMSPTDRRAADYRIEIHAKSQFAPKEGRGALTMRTTPDIYGERTLELENGDQITIGISTVTSGDRALFTVSGPIPGY